MSNDGGVSFGDVINLSNSVGSSGSPAIAASGNNVYVVWNDLTSGNAEIHYRKSTDGGHTFGSAINLSNDARDSLEPACPHDGNLDIEVDPDCYQDNTNSNNNDDDEQDTSNDDSSDSSDG